ncbi:MAG: serine protease [Candidatus Paceibacterota bacterium]
MEWFSRKAKRAYRIFLDGVVIIIALTLAWPLIVGGYYWFVGYEDLTIPDEMHALDERIERFLDTAQFNFETKYQHPTSADSYQFASLHTRTPLADTENYKQSVKSIVYITTVDDVGWYYYGSGSILTEDGVILTNHHVIEDSEAVIIATADGELYEVTEVLAYDHDLDVAFLKIDAEGLTPLPIGDSDAVAVGEKTLVIGHPEGLNNSLSLGNISGIRDYSSQGAGIQLQITNPISGGNSGGAVLNQYGELIAVPSWSIEYEGNFVQVQNLNFAVPIQSALDVLHQ